MMLQMNRLDTESARGDACFRGRSRGITDDLSPRSRANADAILPQPVNEVEKTRIAQGNDHAGVEDDHGQA